MADGVVGASAVESPESKASKIPRKEKRMAEEPEAGKGRKRRAEDEDEDQTGKGKNRKADPDADADAETDTEENPELDDTLAQYQWSNKQGARVCHYIASFLVDLRI